MPNEKWTAIQENKAMEAYLQYLAFGTLPAPPNIDAKTEALDQKIKNEPRLFVKMQLIQQRRDLTNPTITADDLVEAFVKHAPGFTERNAITYATWREMGVSPPRC